ncbi:MULTISPECIES: DUF2237 domain-containing protein [unclassified Polynucleobacter]|uniref:DUF2237 family protein n=1 Tax=unclassified Polynucleobacter TaxID=2640945 RepID=UPI002490B163|nr:MULTISPECIES: DUF2237 domain-containing protein [unclassified Polynucleobacter]
MTSTIEVARNVLGEPLVACSFEPLTGFYRDGCCKTGPEDVGSHLVCAIMTDDFLVFSKQAGNDLSTPMPQWRFSGLVAGDQWCLCILRWKEAFYAGCAPKIKLESTHINALQVVELDILKLYAI